MSRVFVLFAAVSLAGCGAARPTASPSTLRVSPQVITRNEATSERELLARGEGAWRAEAWPEVLRVYDLLLRSNPESSDARALALFRTGFALDALGDFDAALLRLKEVQKHPGAGELRGQARLSTLNILAATERWTDLRRESEGVLSEQNVPIALKIAALSGRALSGLFEGHLALASRDVQQALDSVEGAELGVSSRLPPYVAQTKYSLGELRRTRAEAVVLPSKPADFLPAMEARCAALLSAQSAYADAMRSLDPRWAELSGLRIGEMYRKLHQELMALPPTDLAKSTKQKRLFYALMHMRYRVLLEKGVDMMTRTIEFAEKYGTKTSVAARAKKARTDASDALQQESLQIASYGFSEDELNKALEILRRKYSNAG